MYVKIYLMLQTELKLECCDTKILV